MLTNRFSIRHIDFQDLLEDFLVAAVAAILGIRVFLKLTGYPQIGGEGLHISHMLWGGLLMFIALAILLVFLNNGSKRLAALIGGVGFGTFIDEVGKFVTQDNNYFYQPAFAIMYITFISIYIAQRIFARKVFTPTEYLVNSLELMKEAVINDLDTTEKERALTYLKQADQKNPITQKIAELYIQLNALPPKPNFFTKLWHRLKDVYFNLVKRPQFEMIINIFFIAKSVAGILGAAALFLGTAAIYFGMPLFDYIKYDSFSELAQLFSTNVAGVFVVAGVLTIRKNRLQAYKWFKRSLLVSLFLTYVFLFYRDELGAFSGFLFNGILLATINFMIQTEKSTAVNKVESNS